MAQKVPFSHLKCVFGSGAVAAAVATMDAPSSVASDSSVSPPSSGGKRFAMRMCRVVTSAMPIEAA